MYLKYKKQNKTKTWLRYVFFVAAIAGWVLSYSYIVPAKVDAYLKTGCYTAYQGSGGSTIYTKSTCPSTSPENGYTDYSDACFVSTVASSQGATPYTRKNCVNTGPRPTNVADCNLIGGVFANNYCEDFGPPTNKTACEAFLGAGKWIDASRPENTTTPAHCDTTARDQCILKEGVWSADTYTCSLANEPKTQPGCENRGGVWKSPSGGFSGVPAAPETCDMVATPTSEIACKARTGASWSSGVCTLASAASNPSAAVDPCVGLSEKDAQSKGCTFKKISTGEDPDAYDISGPTGQSAATAAGKLCGKGMRATLVSVPLGCRGTNNPGEEFNPIIDVLFAIVRFLSAGVGIALIVGLTIAGIQYTVSRGDPNNTAKAIERIRSVFIALFVYIFAYAFLNFIIPGGLLS